MCYPMDFTQIWFIKTKLNVYNIEFHIKLNCLQSYIILQGYLTVTVVIGNEYKITKGQQFHMMMYCPKESKANSYFVFFNIY